MLLPRMPEVRTYTENKRSVLASENTSEPQKGCEGFPQTEVFGVLSHPHLGMPTPETTDFVRDANLSTSQGSQFCLNRVLIYADGRQIRWCGECQSYLVNCRRVLPLIDECSDLSIRYFGSYGVPPKSKCAGLKVDGEYLPAQSLSNPLIDRRWR